MSIQAAQARARVVTLLINASQMSRAFRADETLRPAMRGCALVTRTAGANRTVVHHTADAVRTARRWHARVLIWYCYKRIPSNWIFQVPTTCYHSIFAESNFNEESSLMLQLRARVLRCNTFQIKRKTLKKPRAQRHFVCPKLPKLNSSSKNHTRLDFWRIGGEGLYILPRMLRKRHKAKRTWTEKYLRTRLFHFAGSERVAGVSWQAGAHWKVIDDLATRISAAYARARVPAVLIEAGQVILAVAVNNAFSFAAVHVGIADEWRDASAFGRAIVRGANGVLAARRQ